MTISDTNRERSLRINQQATEKYAALRADPMISEQARRMRMAAVYADAKAELTEMQQTAADWRQARVRSLTRETFGVAGNDPLAAMSYRDAMSRAEQIDDPSKAAFELQRALTAGDDAMARALGQRCVDHGWLSLLDGYVQERPEAGQALAEIASLNNPGNSLVEAGYYFAAKPTELDRVAEYQIDELAQQATEVAQ